MKAYHSFVDYRDMRELIDTAAMKFPHTEFYPCADKKMPSVSGLMLKHCCAAFADIVSEKGIAGEHIGVLGPNSAAWITAFFSVLTAGTVVVPISKDAGAEELEYSVKKADVSILLYDVKFKARAEKLKDAVPSLELKELHEFIDELVPHTGERRYKPALDSTAALYFTSGTTSDARCVILTHRNMASLCNAVMSLLPLSPKDTGLSILPPSHTFELMTNIVGVLHCGGTMHINESITTVKRNMKKYEPTILVVVPLILQTLHKQILNEAKKKGRLDEFQKAVKLSGLLQRFGIDISHKLFKDVYSVFGGNLRYFFCGGAPLDEELIRFYKAIGITVLQGYGITECSPVVSANLPGANKIGSVGRAFPCCEVKIINGEICVRGDSVSPGYYNDEAATREAFRDGWFHTGDIGRIDSQGYIFFGGREKNLIVLPNGENVSPEQLEQLLYRVDGVEDALVSQDGGIICAEVYADRSIIPDEAALQKVVDGINSGLPLFKQIGRIKLREKPFEKTSTQKIKRYRRGKK